MLGIYLPAIGKKLRIRNNENEVSLVIMDSQEKQVLEEFKVTDPERIALFDVYKGYLMSTTENIEMTTEEKYNEIVNNFKKTFNV